MLRRLKKDVNAQLPKKEEQVLFCRLTKEQVIKYREYINSREVEECLDGERTLTFRAITILRKICNHPDLLITDESEKEKLPQGYGRIKSYIALCYLGELFPFL